MLHLIGIRKNVDIKIREKLALTFKKQVSALRELKEIFEEVVIISTCNRTEIYFSGNFNKNNERELKEIFTILEWDYWLMEYVFCSSDEYVAKHLFEVSCGFHSKILGEDQILGQIRAAYELGLEEGTINSKLLRLFQDAISCGKKFRNESRLYKIPVSSSSVAVSKALDEGAESMMIMGYGTISSLVVKYALSSQIKKLYVVVRDKDKTTDLKDSRITILDFTEIKSYINNIDAIISATTAPHTIIKKDDIEKQGKKLVIIDLALPRDVEEEVKEYDRVQLYDIDLISKLDSYNKNLRRDKMYEYKFLVDDYLTNYLEWLKLRDMSYYIKEFKENGDEVVQSRIKAFNRKSKNNEDLELAETLIKSTSDYYINRAIKVLKEERLKGREDQCLKILQEIFMTK